jgi:hypothetical protein
VQPVPQRFNPIERPTTSPPSLKVLGKGLRLRPQPGLETTPVWNCFDLHPPNHPAVLAASTQYTFETSPISSASAVLQAHRRAWRPVPGSRDRLEQVLDVFASHGQFEEMLAYDNTDNVDNIDNDDTPDTAASSTEALAQAIDTIAQQCFDILWDDVSRTLQPLLARIAQDAPRPRADSTLRMAYRANPMDSYDPASSEVLTFDDYPSDDDSSTTSLRRSPASSSAAIDSRSYTTPNQAAIAARRSRWKSDPDATPVRSFEGHDGSLVAESPVRTRGMPSLVSISLEPPVHRR